VRRNCCGARGVAQCAETTEYEENQPKFDIFRSLGEFYNQSRRLNIQYNPSTSSTMIDVLVTKPPTVLMPG
jgi:hypothetical protein